MYATDLGSWLHKPSRVLSFSAAYSATDMRGVGPVFFFPL